MCLHFLFCYFIIIYFFFFLFLFYYLFFGIIWWLSHGTLKIVAILTIYHFFLSFPSPLFLSSLYLSFSFFYHVFLLLFFLLSSYISLLFLSHILEEGSPFIFKRGGCSFWMVVLFFVLVSKLNKSLEAYIKGLTLYLPFCFICFWEKKRKIPSRVSHTQCVQKFPRCPHVCYCLFDILPTMITFSTLLLCKRGSTLSLDLSFFSAWHLLFIFSQFLPFLVSVDFFFLGLRDLSLMF